MRAFLLGALLLGAQAAQDPDENALIQLQIKDDDLQVKKTNLGGEGDDPCTFEKFGSPEMCYEYGIDAGTCFSVRFKGCPTDTLRNLHERNLKRGKTQRFSFRSGTLPLAGVEMNSSGNGTNATLDGLFSDEICAYARQNAGQAWAVSIIEECEIRGKSGEECNVELCEKNHGVEANATRDVRLGRDLLDLLSPPGAGGAPVDADYMPYQLDRIDQRDLPLDGIFADAPREGTVFEGGKGLHIYVMDTGINFEHQDFEGRAIPELEWPGEEAEECTGDDRAAALAMEYSGCAADRNGHGTHCAGVAGGKQFGVAKRAAIHAVKTLNDSGRTDWAAVAGSVSWIATNAPPRSVISGSFGSLGKSNTVRVAIDGAVNTGIVIVVAAGNESDDACRYTPAYTKTAITVGATTSKDVKASFSNFGPCIDIFAPGEKVMSALAIDSKTQLATKDGTLFLSGTSMACPQVAGASILLFQRWPNIHSSAVRSKLNELATKDKVQYPGEGSPNRILFTGGRRPEEGDPDAGNLDTPEAKPDYGAEGKAAAAAAPAKKKKVVADEGSACFPGQSTVQVYGRGNTQLADLQAGDRVLVSHADGARTHEQVLNFLHAMHGGKEADFVTVTHSRGEIRASANHLVFEGEAREAKLAADLQVGDQLVDIEGPSKVLAVRFASGHSGMYAPLTSSGTIVVDGVSASNYAVSSARWLPHSAAHALLFPLRMYHQIGLTSASQHELHPFMEKYLQLGVADLHKFVSA